MTSDQAIPARIAVVGLGISGRSAGVVLLDSGVDVMGFDQARPSSEIGFPVVSEADGAELGRRIVRWRPDAVVASPGISVNSPLLRAVSEASIPLWSEVELAWRLQESGPRSGRPWLCITGTNGKTTTAHLVTAMLRAAGERTAEVGNVGLPITSQVADDAETFVVEVSSFQLETTSSMRPAQSMCLNVEADHLDWHGSEAAYRAAKAGVYARTTGTRLYFADDPVVAAMAADAPGSRGSELLGLTLEAPEPGQIGVAEGWIVDHRDGRAARVARLDDIPFFVERARSSALAQDIVASAAMALVHGIAPQTIAAALAEFEPDAHRQALVGQSDGVRWIDDSKATNTHAAEAALRDLLAGSAVWIAGGDPKGQDFEGLVSRIASRLRAVVLIGADREPLREALRDRAPGVPVIEIPGDGTPDQWMPRVVDAAASLARPGDSVVLAPACASWDQFTSYKERGRIFAEAVARGVLDGARS